MNSPEAPNQPSNELNGIQLHYHRRCSELLQWCVYAEQIKAADNQRLATFKAVLQTYLNSEMQDEPKITDWLSKLWKGTKKSPTP